MKITADMKKLFKEIEKAQIGWHTTGAQVEYEYTVERITDAGNTIRYIAKRDDSVRGLSYNIYKETISIAKGFNREWLGYTHEFARETVEFIERLA